MTIRLLADAQSVRVREVKAGQVREAIDQAWSQGAGRSTPLLVGLQGSDPCLMALVSDGLLADGHRLALIPCGMAEAGNTRIGAHLDVWVDLDDDRVECRRERYDRQEDLPPFDVAYFTSGSTSRPKGVGVSLANLRLTTDWYRLIYRLDRESTILTCMPFSYNFTFVAAFLQAKFTGTRLGFAAPEQIHDLALRQVALGRRTVLLANPVVLERFLDLKQGRSRDLLIDSGGAPLSRHAVETIRAEVADLREGYGLSETCSLTHFDLIGDWTSLGTVGQPMPGVRTELRDDSDGKPCLWIQSPNTCRWFEADQLHAIDPGAWMRTGDLGAIDPQGNLRLLARSDDSLIHGFWPRDTLNAIGPDLGLRCALVQHKDDHPKVRIRLNGGPDAAGHRAIVKRASTFLDLPPGEIGVQGSDGRMLHSLKLPRS